MNSFVKPSARTKFGIAAASTAALLVSPLGVLPASASELDVTNCNASGPNSLRGAVTAANAAPGYDTVMILTTEDCTVTVTNTIEINESLTIYNYYGNEFTLTHDSSLTGPVMIIDEADLLSPGGLLDVPPTNVTITGLDFDGQDRATSYAQLEIADSEMNGTVFINNSSFSNAEAGAVDINNANFTTTVYFTDFIDNAVTASGADGGAINTVGELRVNNSYFGFNYAKDDGGAIFSLNAPVTISRSTFSYNSAPLGQGGAVFVDTDVESKLIVDEEYGYSYYAPYALRLNASLFEGNSAYKGGALHVFGRADTYTRATLNNNTFDSNMASVYGGAIYVANTVMMIGAYGPYQGGDYVNASERSLFSSNSALVGGAITAIYADLQIGGTTFEGNSADTGGALAHLYADLSIGASRFDGNAATVSSGAIYAKYLDAARIYSSSFVENVADFAGAIGLAYSRQFSIYSNTFYNNAAGSDFSQVYIYAPSAGSYSIFTNNTVVDTLNANSNSLTFFNVSNNTYIGANIFASTADRGAQIYSGTDAGANLFTYYGTIGTIFAPRSKEATIQAVGVPSRQVSWNELDLQELAEYDAFLGPDVFSQVIPIGPDSAALDLFSLEEGAADALYVPEQFVPWAFYVDGRQGLRFNVDAYEPLAGSALDAGAFEAGARTWFDFDEEEQIPTTPNLSINAVSKPSISAVGDSFSVFGTGLDDVTELFVAGVKVSFRVVSSTELAVTSGALPVGVAEILAIATDGRATFQLGVDVTDTPATTGTPSFWTKNIGNGQVKLYAKNVVGAGKVRFMHNGKEIAWINAVDETDPKLRKAAGAAYLVRTVNLVSGKNRLEITLDGVRVRYTTYTK
jgi:predicted outer membrane repeat protein